MRAPLRCRRGRLAISLCAVLASAVPVSRLPALGTEEFGNKPLGPQPGWAAGLIDAINDTHRVYTSWVNGNENFYFSGDSSALEAAIETFAKVKVDAPEVILLPVPGETKSFEGKPVTFNWRLHAPSGIYLAHVLREKDSNVQFRKPTLFVHIAGGISIEKLKVPKDVGVLDAGDLLIRARRGLQSKDQDIRGQAAYLAGEYPYAEGAVDLLTEALDDPQEQVVRSAAGALRRAGKLAEMAIAALRKRAGSADAKVQAACKEAAAAIESAKTPTEDETKDLRESQRKIREFKAARREGK